MNKSIIVLMIVVIDATMLALATIAISNALADPGASGHEQQNPGDAKESAPGHQDKAFDAPGKEALDAGLIGPRK
jgi:hypothetical protein